MEQLTTQLDLEAAGALADHAVQRHVLEHEGRPSDPNATTAHVPAPATSQPADKHDAPPSNPEPRLLSIATSLTDPGLSRFERRAISRFKRNPDADEYPREYAEDGSNRFRYA